MMQAQCGLRMKRVDHMKKRQEQMADCRRKKQEQRVDCKKS